jgi:hypothetical protein
MSEANMLLTIFGIQGVACLIALSIRLYLGIN